MDDDRLRELMSAYQAGSAAAFDELYGSLASSLYGYLAGLCRDRSLAEELLQETFLQIHRSRHTYRADAPLSPWAFAIARHVAHMHRRAASVRSQMTSAEDPDATPHAARIEEAVANRQRLSRALAELPVEGRRLLVLHHVFGFNFHEIGARLRIRADAAKVRASRGRAALRSLLGGKE